MTTHSFLSGLLVLTLTTSAGVMAQQVTAPTTQTARRAGKAAMPYKAGDPATRARKMTDQLTQQLGLDDATAKKVYDIMLARDQRVDAIQTGSDDNRTKNTSLKANADDVKSKMQGVLTADQFTKFQAMKRRGGGNRTQPAQP